jgi:hypothetical protein
MSPASDPGSNPQKNPPKPVDPPSGDTNNPDSKEKPSTSSSTKPTPVTTVTPAPPATTITTAPNSSRSSQPKHVLIDRDYRETFTIRFSTKFPPALQNRLDPETFAFTVNQINSMFQHAEKCDCKGICQTLLGYFTLSFIYTCWKSKYEKCIEDVSIFVAAENEHVYRPRGLRLVDPVMKGLRNLEIVIIEEPQ